MTTNNSPLKIGWAARDVTPQRPANLMGQFHMRISQGVNDPLTVTALAIAAQNASGLAAVLLLSGDMAFLPHYVQQGIRDAVHRQVPDLDTAKIIINATHTHTAPMMEDGFYPPVSPGIMTGKEYADFFIERAAQALVEAWRGCGKATVAWGLGHAVVGRNRRAVYFDDLSKRTGYVHSPGTRTTRFAAMYGATNDAQFSHIEGYEDHSVDLLYTWNNRDELTGVVGNLALVSWMGEPFVEAQLALKLKSPALYTFVAHLSNGYVGYVPTRLAFRHGGFETRTANWSKLQPGALEAIEKKSVTLLRKLF
ncbi:MAG: hypothetical protein KKE37_07750, partial [Verrucomicrobia bacterium]|nr:hypothetical protein [Verrucomicrobiota bacterium]MBU4289923.1 hypothetical protein [Verrucomicrobiota bacterium]MBU4429229.1 hypothetical protein [Verrucomicrobiota bacterium]MCG2680750.1 hypothetical protein [Kiritimatiellia bacterium]